MKKTGMMITGTIAFALMACSMVSCSDTTRDEIKETANAVVSEIAKNEAATEAVSEASTAAAETAVTAAADPTAAQTAKPAETVQIPSAAALANITPAAAESTKSAQISSAAEKKDEQKACTDDNESRRSEAELQARRNARGFAGAGNYECVSSEIVLGDNSDYTFRVGVADLDDSSAPVSYYIATRDYAMIEADWYKYGPDTDKAKVYWTYEFEPGYADFGFKVGSFHDLNGSGAMLTITKSRVAAGVYDCTVTVPDASGSCYEWVFTGEHRGSALSYNKGDLNCSTYDGSGILIDSCTVNSGHSGRIIDTETTLEWTDTDGTSYTFDNGETLSN